MVSCAYTVLGQEGCHPFPVPGEFRSSSHAYLSIHDTDSSAAQAITACTLGIMVTPLPYRTRHWVCSHVLVH
jgi:hypothetical protein